MDEYVWNLFVDRARARIASWGERLRARPLTVAAVVLGIALAGLAAWWFLRPPAPAPELALPRAETATATSAPAASSAAAAPSDTTSTVSAAGPDGPLVVDVVGAVARPGLVRIAAGSRVADAVAAAGGPGAGADLERLNLAAPLDDGERIYVPHVGETSIPLAVNGSGGGVSDDGGSGATPGARPAAPVDLNDATEQQLETLPGVGPSTAAAILDYRRQHGRFARVEDLLNVRGIGPAKLAALRSRVRV